MEAFTKLLQARYNAGAVGYHPKAEALGIYHLVFADDIMILRLKHLVSFMISLD